MSLIEDLNWRYATKKYDPVRKIPEPDLDKILEAARLAPSSYGIQPYKVIAIDNKELKEKIVPIAWGQQIVADCSHLLVFAAWDGYDRERVVRVFNHITEDREIQQGNAFDPHTETIIKSQIELSPEAAFEDTVQQACISFAMAIAQAAELKIDNTPMGGFYHDQLDNLLDLREKKLKSVYLLALGYRHMNGDWLSKLKKVRTPKEDFIIKLR